MLQTLRSQMLASQLYPAKLPITIYGENKIFHDKTKSKQYNINCYNKQYKQNNITTNPPYKRCEAVDRERKPSKVELGLNPWGPGRDGRSFTCS